MKLPEIKKRVVAFLSSEEGNISKGSAFKLSALSAMFLFAENVSATNPATDCMSQYARDNAFCLTTGTGTCDIDFGPNAMFHYDRDMSVCKTNGKRCSSSRVTGTFRASPNQAFYEFAKENGFIVDSADYRSDNLIQGSVLRRAHDFDTTAERHSIDRCFVEVQLHGHSSECGGDHLSGGGAYFDCKPMKHTNALSLDVDESANEIVAAHTHGLGRVRIGDRWIIGDVSASD